MNNKTINTDQLNLNVLIDYINECYDGNILYLIAHLDNSIYLLHYLHEEQFTKKELRDTLSALKGIKDCLLKAHLNQQGWFYKSLE